MKKKLNIAVLGSGFMGKAHSNAWLMAGKFFDVPFEPVLKINFGTDMELTKDFADRWGYEEITADWEEAVNRKDVDVIDIVTPTYIHKEMALAAANAGKHIFCEKPCAVTYAQAKAMADAARNAGIVHYLNHNYRRVPAVAYAKEMIERGKLGTIYHWIGTYLQDWIMDPNFPLTWHLQDKFAGGGPLFDLGSHSIDLARFLVGEIESVTAVSKTFIGERFLPGRGAATFASGESLNSEKGQVTVDDACFLMAEFENGALGSIGTTRFAGGRKNHNTFEVYGSKGSLCFNFDQMNELQFCDMTEPDADQGFKTISVTNAVHPYCSAWWAPGHVIGYENTFFHAVADFLNAVSTGKTIEPNFFDGEKITRTLEAAKLSNREGRKVKVAEINA